MYSTIPRARSRAAIGSGCTEIVHVCLSQGQLDVFRTFELGDPDRIDQDREGAFVLASPRRHCRLHRSSIQTGGRGWGNRYCPPPLTRGRAGQFCSLQTETAGSDDNRWAFEFRQPPPLRYPMSNCCPRVSWILALWIKWLVVSGRHDPGGEVGLINESSLGAV